MKRVVFSGLTLTLIFSLFFLAGCGKKKSPIAPAATRPVDAAADLPRRAAAAPTIELSASPSTVERGQQTTLTWKSANASSVLIDEGIGNVADAGSVVISPRESVTYTATAKGAGGEAKASTRITVVDAKVAAIDVTDIDNLARAIQEEKIRDIFFAYDQAELTAEARSILEENARWIRRFPRGILVIEGHCDERGTEEYNLALGDRRAQAARGYLLQLGVDPNQTETISYGEERPFDPGHDEAAWAKNRRVHFVAKRY